MNAERYLKRIKLLNRRISTKKSRLEQYEEACCLKAVSFEADRVQSTHTNQMENAIVNAVDLKREIRACEAELKEIETNLNKLAEIDADAFFVLYQKYFCMKTYKQIAFEADKSTSWVDKKRQVGLNILNKILKEQQ